MMLGGVGIYQQGIIRAGSQGWFAPVAQVGVNRPTRRRRPDVSVSWAIQRGEQGVAIGARGEGGHGDNDGNVSEFIADYSP